MPMTMQIMRGLLAGLAAVFTGAMATSAFMKLLAVSLGVLSALVVFLLAALGAWAISVLLTPAKAPDPNVTPDKELDSRSVAAWVWFSLLRIWESLRVAFARLLATISTTATVLLNNLETVVALLLLFTFFFVLAGWHNLLFEGLATVWQEVGALVRTLFLGPLNLLAILGSMILSFIIVLREWVQNFTVIAIERAIVCAPQALVEVWSNATLFIKAFTLATATYFSTLPGVATGFAAAPDYYPAGQALGATLASSQPFFDCACEPFAERIWRPLFLPVRGDAFARSFNASTNILPALLNQGILSPTVGTWTRYGATTPPREAEAIIVRPNFNATIQEAIWAVTNATEFVDEFIPALANTTTILFENLFNTTLPRILPPRKGPLTFVVGGIVDTIGQLFKVFLHWLVNIDIVFSTSNGFLYWRIDDALEAVRRAFRVLLDYLVYFETWLRQLGDILAGTMPMQIGVGELKTVPPLERPMMISRTNGWRYAHALLAHERGDFVPLITEGQLLQAGFDFIADYIDIIRCFVDTFVEFALRLIALLWDLPVGTVYNAVTEVEITGFPNPLLFAQAIWGPGQIEARCVGQVTAIFAGGTTNFTLFSANLTTCGAAKFAAFCASVSRPPFNATGLPLPAFYTPEPFNARQFTLECSEPALSQCDVILVPSIVDSNGTLLALPRNQFELVLRQFTEVLVCSTRVFTILCPQCRFLFADIGLKLGNSLTCILLPFLDLWIHLDLVLTTNYLTQIDFDSAFTSIEVLVSIFSDTLRRYQATIGGGMTCPPFDPNAPAGGHAQSNMLCCIASLMDALTAVVVETLRQAAHVLELVIEAIITLANGGNESVILNAIIKRIDLQPIFRSVEEAMFDVACIALQFITWACNPATCAALPAGTACLTRTVLSTAFANIVSGVILLIPRVAILLGNALFDIVTSPLDVARNIELLVTAFIGPLFDLLAVIFTQLSAVFLCVLGGNPFSSIFLAIGSIFLPGAAIRTAITLIVETVVDALAFVFGIIEFLVTRDSTLLNSSIDLFGTIFGQLIILIFGKSACVVQDDVCLIDNDFRFAYDACIRGSFVNDSNENNDFPPYTFKHCTRPGEQSELFCGIDASTCSTPLPSFGCPTVPFGCCGGAPFPANGVIPGQPPLFGCDFTNSSVFCDIRIRACPFILPPGIPFFDVQPLPAQLSAYGQSGSVVFGAFACPKFANLTECRLDHIMLLNPTTGQPLARDAVERARPFGTAMSHDHQQLLSAPYCLDMLADYGMTKAMRVAAKIIDKEQRLDTLGALDQTAARCYNGLSQLQTLPTTAPTAPPTGRLTKISTAFRAHLVDSANSFQHSVQRAYTQSKVSANTVEQYNRVHWHVESRDWTMFATLLGRRLDSLRVSMPLHHEPETRLEQRTVLRSIRDSLAQSRQQRKRDASREPGVLAHIGAIVVHTADMLEHGSYHIHEYLDRRRKRSVTVEIAPLVEVPPKPLTHYASLAVREWVSQRKTHATQKLSEWIGSVSRSEHYDASRQHSATWADLMGLFTPSVQRKRQQPPIGIGANDTTLLFGIEPCNTSVQQICTGCAFFDNGLLAIENSYNSTTAYYTAPLGTGGFPDLLARFQTSVHNTLEDPIGTDTYTTTTPRTISIWRRFLSVHYFWMWNTTEFRQLLYNTPDGQPPGPINSTDAVGSTERRDIAISLAAGRVDSDLIVLNATRPLVTPIISRLEQFAFTVSTIRPLEALQRLANRYIWCSYGPEVRCQSTHGVDLFDGLVNTALLAFIFYAIVSLIPGAWMFALMFIMIVGFPFLLWVSYDAPPLCTIPSFFGGIPGIPVCFPMDVYQLVEQTLTECAPVPVGLIDPADFAAATTQLCATPDGGPPRYLLCSEAAGFIDGFDNIGFSLASIFPQSTVQFVASAIAEVVPAFGAVVASYTEERLASLEARDSLGSICNFITIGNLIGAILVFGVATLIALTLLIADAVIIAAIIFAIIALLFAINYILVQRRKAAIAMRRRRKMKQE